MGLAIIMKITVLIIIGILQLSVNVSGGLYENIGSIHILDSSNFSRFVASQPTLVQFYLRNCGGCHFYAPKYKNISQSVANWQWVVKLAVIDCADSDSFNIANSEGVTFFPYFKFFPKDGTSYPFQTHQNESSFRLELVTNLLNIDELNYLRPSSESKNMDPDSLTLHSKYVEKNAMIILDLQTQLTKKLISVVNTELPDDSFSLTGANETELLNNVNEKKLRMYLANQYGLNSNDKPSAPQVTVAQNVTLKLFQLSSMLPVYAADILASLKILFFQDVTLKPVIEGEDLSALRELLNVITKYLPLNLSYDKAISFLKAKVDDSSSLTSQDWTNLLETSLFPKTKLEFIACKGSEPQYRGYPCGLWIMFHAMTVQRFLTATSPDPDSSVAHALNRFVPRFFSCSFCAYHFAAVSSNVRRPGESVFPDRADIQHFKLVAPDPSTLPTAPTNPREEILWLNVAHNAVNKRISKAVTEDPMAPKAIFPSPQQCPVCWSADEAMKASEFSGLPDKLDELTAFLTYHYRPSSWKWTGLPVSYKDISLSFPETFHVVNFTTGDVALASFISVVCTLLLAVLAYYICCRRRRISGGHMRV